MNELNACRTVKAWLECFVVSEYVGVFSCLICLAWCWASIRPAGCLSACPSVLYLCLVSCPSVPVYGTGTVCMVSGCLLACVRAARRC